MVVYEIPLLPVTLIHCNQAHVPLGAVQAIRIR